MQVREVMTHQVQFVRPIATIQEAARKMRELDVGALPICDSGKIVGIVTDRDITIRATAAGADPGRTPVREVCSTGLVYCYEDDDVRNVARMMRDHQVRRIPVINRAKKLVGIVALKDLALEAGDERMSGEVLEGVSRENGVPSNHRMQQTRIRSQYDRNDDVFADRQARGSFAESSQQRSSTAEGYGMAESARTDSKRGQTVGSFAGRGPRGYRRSDDRIREEVCECLTAHHEIDASDIDVEVSGGEVRLLGTVDDNEAKRMAERSIQELPGVLRVQNELRVSRADERGATEVTGRSNANATNRA
jgi:CBS domain-containing protein